jgi:hypothetical protein
VVQNVDVAGAEFRGLIQRVAGRIRVTRAKLNHSQPHKSLGIPRVEVNLVFQRCHGARKVVLAVTCDTQKQVRAPETGRQNDGMLKSRQRVINAALL